MCRQIKITARHAASTAALPRAEGRNDRTQRGKDAPSTLNGSTREKTRAAGQKGRGAHYIPRDPEGGYYTEEYFCFVAMIRVEALASMHWLKSPG